MKKLSIAIIAIFTMCIILAGCSNSKTAEKDPSTIRIVTSFYPIYISTINVAGGVEGVEIINMTKPQTGCLHDYQLTPGDMATLEKANIFVANGAGMESFLDKVLQQNSHLTIVDASKDIELLASEDSKEQNPHVWLSVPKAIQQVKNIEAQLIEADPKHKDSYKANAEAYIEKLEALNREMHENLDNLPNKNIVTFHEAFPYFASEFGLNIIKVIEREPGTEPTPNELADTISEIKGLNNRVLFTEPQYSPEAAKTIAHEADARIYILDPVVTGTADESAKDAYINAMHHNMDILKEALK